MKMRSIAIAATALFLPLSAAACGDSGSDKPDTADIRSELVKRGMPEEQASCITKALEDSGLTYDDYQKASGDAASVASDPKFKKYLNAAIKCFSNGADVSIPDLGN